MSYDESTDFAEKAKYLSDFFEIMGSKAADVASWRALEIGGEGGLLAGLFGQHVAHVISTDIVNSQVRYNGSMPALLDEKFQRNGSAFPMNRVEFLTADAQDLPFRDDWFDFCFSQNAFEHIPDPERALREAIRVTRRHGYIYLVFDPIWTADSGNHFHHRLGEPWLHLLADDETVSAKMGSGGANAGEIESYMHHMNRRPISYYREMFPRVLEELGVQPLVHHEWSGCVEESHLEHPNLHLAAQKLRLQPEDLLVRGIRYLIQV